MRTVFVCIDFCSNSGLCFEKDFGESRGGEKYDRKYNELKSRKLLVELRCREDELA